MTMYSFPDWGGDLEDYNKKLGFSQPIDPANNPEASFAAILGFMQEAHKAVNSAGAYFSVDVFVDAPCSLNLPLLDRILSACRKVPTMLCPMPYPSLWWVGYPRFRESYSPSLRQVILGTLKNGDVLRKYGRVRPWLQDHTDPWQGSRVVEYGPKEVRAQIDGVKDYGKASGWILYDLANAYRGAFNGAVNAEK